MVQQLRKGTQTAVTDVASPVVAETAVIEVASPAPAVAEAIPAAAAGVLSITVPGSSKKTDVDVNCVMSSK